MKAPTPILPAVVTPNALDRAVMAVAPVYGARRYQARVAIAMTGQYAGAKWRKAALKAWRTFAGSADADGTGSENDDDTEGKPAPVKGKTPAQPTAKPAPKGSK